MTLDPQVYRSGLSAEALVSELRALLSIELGTIRLSCRYLADFADRVEARSCPVLATYSDVYHAARCLLGIGVHSARERVRVGRALRDLPCIDQALTSGTVSYSRAREVTRVAHADDEARWLELARTLPMRQLERRVVEAAGSDPATPDAAKTAEPAKVHWTTPATVELRMQLPAEAWALLERAMQGARRAGESSLSDAEALAAVARDALAAQQTSAADPNDPRRAVVLYECQTCHRTELDTGAGTVELLPGPAATLGCGAAVHDLRTAGRIVRRGGPLPKSIDRAVRLRDRNGCRVPGCHRRRYVDVHHIHEQSRGGEHSRRNCCCLCTSHHAKLHDGLLRIEGDADGELLFYDRDGQPIASRVASQCGTPSRIGASPEATTLLTVIGGRGGWTVDALCEASGLAVPKVVVALVELQLAGRVREEPCGYGVKAA